MPNNFPLIKLIKCSFQNLLINFSYSEYFFFVGDLVNDFILITMLGYRSL